MNAKDASKRAELERALSLAPFMREKMPKSKLAEFDRLIDQANVELARLNLMRRIDRPGNDQFDL